MLFDLHTDKDSNFDMMGTPCPSYQILPSHSLLPFQANLLSFYSQNGAMLVFSFLLLLCIGVIQTILADIETFEKLALEYERMFSGWRREWCPVCLEECPNLFPLKSLPASQTRTDVLKFLEVRSVLLS